VPLCPKCRQLGYRNDCSELLLHGQGLRVMDDDDVTEMRVTVTFPVTVNTSDDVGPRELATQLRDRWVDEPETLRPIIDQALVDEYDFTVMVQPFDEP
jgi:hypothetical protein